MNLVLLFSEDFKNEDNRVRLTGRRHKHIQEVHKVKLGDRLCVGCVDGKIGTGKVVIIDRQSVVLEVDLTEGPPAPLALTLLMALPRPQVIKRALLCASSLGIKKIILLNFFRVEKSLWQSSSLHEGAVRDQLVLGLEQAKDTVLPEVIIRKRFKGFVEDELPDLIKGSLPLVAHPGASHACPKNVKQPITLLIGPEGGLIDYELEKLAQLGFKAVDLGPRILRVESALPFIVGRLF